MPNITLNCLVNGESTNNVFPVDIDTGENKLVGNLKEFIKEKKRNAFRSVDASDLTLWKVNIPVDDEEALADLALEDNEEEGVQKLNPTWKIRKAFPDEPKEKHVHIIIKRPAGECFS